jgi:hypothetical protein
MTPLHKPITRLTTLVDRRRQLAVRLLPADTDESFALPILRHEDVDRGDRYEERLEFRPKGTRQVIRVPLREVFRYAMRRGMIQAMAAKRRKHGAR